MAGKITLQYGSNGSEVKELQQYLNNNGYSLGVDGIFGNNTLSAVKDYQQKNGLSVDGIVGNNTWTSLLSSNQSASNTSATNPLLTAPTLNGTSYTKTDEGITNKTAMDDALSNFNNFGANWQYAETNKKILEDYLNRDPFSYDLNGDALYQQYKDKYIQQGKMAMQDTMGQASAMTGGYGNSYAQSVGQQAYQNSLDNLNDIVPELYQMAYDRYNQQGQDMINQLSVLDADYNRGYTAVKDKLGIASDNFYNAADLYGSELDRANGISQQDWQNAMTIYNTEEEKKRWEKEYGLNERQVALQEKAYEDSKKASPSSTSTGKTYGTSEGYTGTIPAGDGNTTYTSVETPVETPVEKPVEATKTKNATDFINTFKTKEEFYGRGGADKRLFNTYDNYIESHIQIQFNAGNLTEGEVAYLISYYKL